MGSSPKAPPASTPAARAVMKGNRRRDTRPELVLRRALHQRGLRYRVDYPLRPDGGRPIRVDIAFTRRRVAVFVDGCFWHGCPVHGTRPRSNRDFWDAKIARNKARDLRDRQRLESAGWTVLRVWEHDALDSAALIERLARPPSLDAPTLTRPPARPGGR